MLANKGEDKTLKQTQRFVNEHRFVMFYKQRRQETWNYSARRKMEKL